MWCRSSSLRHVVPRCITPAGLGTQLYRILVRYSLHVLFSKIHRFGHLQECPLRVHLVHLFMIFFSLKAKIKGYLLH